MMYPFLLWIIGWNVMEGWSSTITMISAGLAYNSRPPQ